MKKDLTKFKTPKWRKAAKDCVKLWEDRVKGKKSSISKHCPLCLLTTISATGFSCSCRNCVAYAVAGGKQCTRRWISVGNWHDIVWEYQYDYADSFDVDKSKLYARIVLKIAKKIEELIK